MAAVQGGQIDPEGEKDIKTEPSNDGSGNNNANDGGVLSSSPDATSSSGTTKTLTAGAEDQQTLLAVLQFLKRNKLSESVNILRREAGLSDDADDSKVSDSAGSGLGSTVNVDAEGGDANSLLNRVTIATAAPPATAPPAPTKGRDYAYHCNYLGYQHLNNVIFKAAFFSLHVIMINNCKQNKSLNE